jgi:crotonobetainyl-CoA:carnitine CoA-transferase CaiB-like acyl-CoA transferase
MTPGPLDGIRVLDLTRFISGPFCTQLLANLGADVVKLEKKGRGDEAREVTPTSGSQSLYYLAMNSNKRSVEVDYRTDEGRELVLRMAEVADVFVENFRAGTLEKMGLAPETLLARNPRLVITRVSGFGQDGPLSAKPVFDAIAQAESGLMSITGRPDGPPMPSGTFVVDYATGLQAAVATLAGVIEARSSGAGQVIDVSLLDSAFAMLMSGPMEKILLDREMTRIGNDDRYGSPGGTFPASDGWVHFVAGNPEHFARLLSAMERPELADDPRFATVSTRMENRSAIDSFVREWTSSRTTSQLLEVFASVGIPAGRVATVPEALENPQIVHRNDLVTTRHSELGDVPAYGVVPKFSRTPGSVRRAAPVLGEHTEEAVADWLGTA